MRIKDVESFVSNDKIREEINKIINKYINDSRSMYLSTGVQIGLMFPLNTEFNMKSIVINSITNLVQFIENEHFDMVFDFAIKYITYISEIYQLYLEDKTDTKFLKYIKNVYIISFNGMMNDTDTRNAAACYKTLMRTIDVHPRDNITVKLMGKIRERKHKDGSKFLQFIYSDDDVVPKDINIDLGNNTNDSIYKSQLSNIRDDYTIMSNPKNNFLNDYIIDEDEFINNIRQVISSNDLKYTISEDFLGYLVSNGYRMISIKFNNNDTIYRTLEHVDKIYLLFMNEKNLNGYEIYPDILGTRLEIEPDELKYSFKVDDDLFNLSNDEKE